jgi:hypothetical protein
MTDHYGEAAQAVEEGLEKQFEVGPQSELKIDSFSGNILVRGQEGTTITVRARRIASSRAITESDLTIVHYGRRLSVGSEAGPGGMAPVELDVTVPRDCSVEAETTSGEIDIEGVRGQVKVDSASGNVTCRDLGGSLEGETASGNLHLERSHLRGFDLETASGNLRLETTFQAGEQYRIETASGDVDLRFPAGAGATVRVETASGEIECRLPAEVLEEHSHPGHHEWAGRINGGNAEVEISTMSGDVHLGAGGALLPERPDEPEVPFTPPPLNHSTTAEVAASSADTTETAGTYGDTTAVLSALERGEITVEEAMQRLDELA